MTRPASGPGRLLERIGDDAPRGMTVQDRTRLIGRLRHFSWLCQENPTLASQTLGPAMFIHIPAAVAAPPGLKGAAADVGPRMGWLSSVALQPR